MWAVACQGGPEVADATADRALPPTAFFWRETSIMWRHALIRNLTISDMAIADAVENLKPPFRDCDTLYKRPELTMKHTKPNATKNLTLEHMLVDSVLLSSATVTDIAGAALKT
eukprot:CAMPEP_0198528728 /NCGR_PEP_ID=MMETSP1462-20131121/25324_1 /TAXON_ID=1333877 /ORGANISM="Brandtodinium nutriculum, Strain RCC3387" /LENGTH=113 /DNA_ID=CAMNT_0044258553 /DNA_START=704 /DNA_END=1045 /DNA_ORIENTATION=+